MRGISILSDYLSGGAQSRYRALGVTALIFLGGIFPAYLGIEMTRGIMTPGPRTVADVLMDFDRQGFDLQAVADGQGAVPRVFLTSLPSNWRQLAMATERKRAFTMVVLPLILRANEILLAERARLQAISARIEAKQDLAERDRRWVLDLASGYKSKARKVTRKAVAALIGQVDIVPPSLALAQAAIESGWGTSRFATQGNALFGQWSEDTAASMIPAGRDANRTYAVQRFVTLLDSVMAYMRNLNSHRAYRKFRAARAKIRAADELVTGLPLAALLGPYSQQGSKYVQVLASIIEKNRLGALDGVKLKL